MSSDFDLNEEKVTDPNVVLANDLRDEEQEAFLDEVGTLIFKSTVMRYLSVLTPEQAQVFEAFIKVNAESENFIEILSEQYPEFKVLLDEEMEAFNNELEK